MLFELIFVRHGESCANVLLKSPNVRNKVKHKGYTDPELSTRGRLLSIQKGPFLTAKLEETNPNSPFVSDQYTLGASPLFRAQETAYLMVNKLSKKPIYVFPYLGEVGFGDILFSDNKAIEKEEQKKLFKKRYTGIDVNVLLPNEKDEREGLPDFAKFLRWAEEHPDWFEQGSDGVYRAIIVSHSNSLKKAFPFTNCVNQPTDLPHGEKLDNNDFLVSVFNFNKEALPINSLLDPTAVYPKWHYFDTREFNEGVKGECNTKNNSCRKNVTIKCKTKGGKRKTKKTRPPRVLRTA